MLGRRRGQQALVALALAALALALSAPAHAAVSPELATAVDLAGGADVMAFDLPAVPGAPRVRAATLVRAAPAAITALLMDPAHYGAIIPSLIRADRAGAQIAWELEVPLFNLEGHLALRAQPDGVEMTLTDGDLAPGRVIFRVAPRPDGRTVLEIDAQLDVRRTSWFVRRVMARSPFGESAALAAAAWVALRATALRAEHAGQPSAWRPTAPPGPPASWVPETRALGDPRLGPLRTRGAVALVARTAGDRLGGVAVAVTVAARAEALAPALRDPRTWHAFPGWRTVRAMPPPLPTLPASADVEDSIPFVDLDATWQAQPGAALRWTAVGGAARGARLGWDLLPDGARTVVVLTLHPRLEQTGAIPRRLIAAEPLLEHGLAVSLALVDALGVRVALENSR